MKKKLIYFMFFLFPAMYSCLDTPEMAGGIPNMRKEPTVTSGENTSSSDGILELTGTVTSVGKIGTFFKKGFRWGYSATNFTDSVFLENTDPETGDFFYQLSNVRGDTTVYWQAFARNDFGSSFGNIISYMTPPIFTYNAGYSFTGAQRSDFTFFTLNNNLYFTCGYRNVFFSDINRFDKTNWWYTVPAFPGAARANLVAFTIDSLAYVGTGRAILPNIFGDFYVFNGNAHEWNGVPIQTPTEMSRYDAVAFSLNNKGYVLGGNSGNGVLSDVWEYSVTNGIDAWRKMNDFPYSFSGGLSFSNNERVFVGFGSNNTRDSLWEYNAAADSWKVFASSPTNSQGEQARIYSGVITHDKIYLLDVTNIIWELDLATGMYKQKSMLPEKFPSPPPSQYMFYLGDAIYIGLGVTELFYRYYPLWDN